MFSIPNEKPEPEGGQGIDQSPLSDLFTAPFKSDLVLDKWVFWPLIVSLIYHGYNYANEDIVPAANLNIISNREYQILYGGIYPFGSAAPEEMFYRGFLQNEFHEMTESAYAAVPLSTAIYILSHSVDSHLAAGISGLYLGALTSAENGRLIKPIAFHFWSDVIMGIHAIASLIRNENASPNPNSSQGYFFHGAGILSDHKS